MGTVVTVDFRQDTIFAVERDDGVFVAVKPICDSLGLNWKSQHSRIVRDEILGEGMVMMTIPSAGGPQETTLLRLELINGWLFTIDESRVRDEETRQRVLTYKRECYQVLFDHFHGKRRAAGQGEETARIDRTSLIGEVREARQTFGRRAAAQLWFQLGLPIVPAMLEDPRQHALFRFSEIKLEPIAPADEETPAA